MVHHDNICPELIGKLRACFIERLAEPLARPVTPEECIVTIAGKRQLARLPGLVVTYAAFFDVALAAVGSTIRMQAKIWSRPGCCKSATC